MSYGEFLPGHRSDADQVVKKHKDGNTLYYSLLDSHVLTIIAPVSEYHTHYSNQVFP